MRRPLDPRRFNAPAHTFAIGVLLPALALLLLATGSAQAHSLARSASRRTQCVSRTTSRSARVRARRACVKPRRPHHPALPPAGGTLSATPVPGAGPGAPAPTSAPSGPGSTPAPIATGGHSPKSPPSEAPPRKGGEAGGKSPLPVETGETVSDPIDPRFLLDAPFGTSSFWLQPWRAYLDTWPASRLLESVGINFNVDQAAAEATAQLLQDSGFKLARVGINWSALSYSDPTTFIPERLKSITAHLTALHDHGLRPLIVLDAYSGSPAPMQHVSLETTAEAPAGASTVTLTPASAALVVDGKTGFNSLTPFAGTPDVLITAVGADGVATLSRPLPAALSAGAHGATTLLYAPFTPPRLADGQPNPAFQATLDGWLNYVGQVSKLAASIVGPGGYDLEVWNELTFGSQFLNSENYYSTAGGEPAGAPAAARSLATAAASPAASGTAIAGSTGSAGAEAAEREEDGLESSSKSTPEYSAESEAGGEVEDGPEAEGAGAGEGGTPESATPEAAAQQVRSATPKSHKALVNKEIRRALLSATAAYVRDPANGISPSVGVSDGFASETPFPSGANAPLGITALSKHPYVGPRSFPAAYREDHIIPLNAIGTRDTLRGIFKPLFVPAYQSLLPEYTLTATGTENLVRDVAPITTNIYGFPHGREVGPQGGSPLQKWVTEYNLGSANATVVGPDGVTPASGPSAALSPADKSHFEAKALLRSLVAMVSKGVSREYFFAAAPGALSLIGNDFFSTLEANPGSYPGDQHGGETMAAFRAMLDQFQGPGPGGPARQLKLDSITQQGNHAQFAGDLTSNHPALYDRDVLAVLPFQSSPTRFVIPVYVMSRDLLTLYEPSASPSDPTRFDLPNESFDITLSNLPETSAAPHVSAFDPLRHEATPARLVSREGTSAVFEVAASDYPRLLSVDYGES